MTKETDFLIQSLFQRENMEEMTLDELKGHSEAFPYSSIVHFLYTSKLKTLYHLDFPEAVSKTALFFHEPQWLNYQLREDTERGNFRMGNYDLQFNDVNEDTPLDHAAPVTEEEHFEEEHFEEEHFEEEHFEEEHFEEDDSLIPNEELTNEITPVVPEELQIAFDPYHTVDYFASLGIKVNHDNDKDELSRKVKSFTSWLKTMKRLQPGTEINTGKDIAAILDSTNKEEELSETIVTEAMAEVYIKQGLRDKAMEVYAKLSLQNPVNSHIFADKISQIKENRI